MPPSKRHRTGDEPSVAADGAQQGDSFHIDHGQVDSVPSIEARLDILVTKVNRVIEVTETCQALLKEHIAQQAPSDTVASTLTKIADMRPSKFEGFANLTDIDIVEDWLVQMEKLFEVTQCLEMHKVPVAVFYLEKEAYDWWDTVRRASRESQPTWEEFQTMIKKRYCLSSLSWAKMQEFLNTEQGDMTVLQLAAKYHQLARYASSILHSEKERIVFFRRMLNREIRAKMLDFSGTTLSDFIDQAVSVEQVLRDPKIGDAQSTDEFENSPRPNDVTKRTRHRVGKKCFNCDEYGHLRAECPLLGIDRVPPQSMRYSRPHAVGSRVGKRCYNCDEYGHLRAKCPLLGIGRESSFQGSGTASSQESSF